MTNIPNEIRQLKMDTGEEVVCEIVQWTDEGEQELVVRAAMKLEQGSTHEGARYYAFRPWMVYQEDPEDLLIVHSHHVVGIAFPNEMLIAQYKEAIADMLEMSIERKRDYEKTKTGESEDVDKIIRDVKNSRERLQQWMLENGFQGDSGTPDNIIAFPKDKLH